MSLAYEWFCSVSTTSHHFDAVLKFVSGSSSLHEYKQTLTDQFKFKIFVVEIEHLRIHRRISDTIMSTATRGGSNGGNGNGQDSRTPTQGNSRGRPQRPLGMGAQHRVNRQTAAANQSNGTTTNGHGDANGQHRGGGPRIQRSFRPRESNSGQSTDAHRPNDTNASNANTNATQSTQAGGSGGQQYTSGTQHRTETNEYGTSVTYDYQTGDNVSDTTSSQV
jgi:hypothetical protein